MGKFNCSRPTPLTGMDSISFPTFLNHQEIQKDIWCTKEEVKSTGTLRMNIRKKDFSVWLPLPFQINVPQSFPVFIQNCTKIIGVRSEDHSHTDTYRVENSTSMAATPNWDFGAPSSDLGSDTNKLWVLMLINLLPRTQGVERHALKRNL